MIIETNPCEQCDFSPTVCSCDIDICMMLGGSPMESEEQYEQHKIERYRYFETDSGLELGHWSIGRKR